MPVTIEQRKARGRMDNRLRARRHYWLDVLWGDVIPTVGDSRSVWNRLADAQVRIFRRQVRRHPEVYGEYDL